MTLSRRTFARTVGVGAATAGLAAAKLLADEKPPRMPRDGKTWRVGVISARINGKPQRVNGHTWHFAQYLHPTIDLPVAQTHLDPGNQKYFADVVRNPACDFGQLPFPDTRIESYYEADPTIAKNFADSFPGVRVAKSLEEMAAECDAVWLGDASGHGEDHYDLLAPALERGLPIFCDKPIGQTVAGVRKIVDRARERGSPLMSGSIFSWQWGVEETRRRVAKGDLGKIGHVVASMAGGYSPDGWFVYGQHPCWMLVSLLGEHVEAMSLFARENTAHGLATFAEGTTGEVWYGRPDARPVYGETSVHFEKEVYRFSPAIDGNWALGHHYEMFSLARAFRAMLVSGVSPTSDQAILNVTAMLYAGALSLKEKSRLVELAEVLG